MKISLKVKLIKNLAENWKVMSAERKNHAEVVLLTGSASDVWEPIISGQEINLRRRHLYAVCSKRLYAEC